MFPGALQKQCIPDNENLWKLANLTVNVSVLMNNQLFRRYTHQGR